jgi:hypothetical protein
MPLKYKVIYYKRGYFMAIIENNSQSRGFGKWKIFTYNPSVSINSIEGFLVVNKDFHVIFKDEKFSGCLFNVPSQNVAFVINDNLVNNYKIDTK